MKNPTNVVIVIPTGVYFKMYFDNPKLPAGNIAYKAEAIHALLNRRLLLPAMPALIR